MLDFNALALSPCVQTFGQPVTYISGSGETVSTNRMGGPLLGIFNRYATEEKIEAKTGLVRQAIAPTLALNILDLPEGLPLPCKAEIILINGEKWEITAPVPDNFGQLLLKVKNLT